MKLQFLVTALFFVLTANAQNVGIGTSTPQARLHITDSAVLFSGPLTVPVTTPYLPPASGAGSRMMWYPQKAAFRVGAVDGTQWDKDSIGRFSFASGYDNKAIGVVSTSMGNLTSASGDASTSMGSGTNASGIASTSMGGSTNASGHFSTSMGASTTASGSYSTSMGNFTIARSAFSLVIGLYNDSTATNRLFEIGNGTANNARNNAMTVLTNGNVGIGTATPDNSAILDIKSSTKGLLMPRMSSAAVTAIANPAKGLLVLDTVKNQLMVNMGTAAIPNWQTIVAASGWSLSGNSGIDSATNFIGTLDTKPFIIKVNNVRSGFVDTITNNTSFGFRALDSSTIGTWNTAIGYKSLSGNKTGENNTGLGWGALQFNSSGSHNTASGTYGLHSNTTGNQNTALGFLAMYLNTTGGQNIAVGSDAMRYNNSGSSNIGIGYTALYFNTTGYSNIGIGTGALFNTGNRSNLVAVGDSALFNNGVGAVNPYEGTLNSAFGSRALFTNTTGYYNTATGTNALRNNSTGFQNTANGTGALVSNTIGSANTSMGLNSMFTNSSGSNNTGIGNAVLASNTIGSNNTATGFYASFNNTNGYSNVAVGTHALFNNSNRSNLVAVGDSALYNNGVGAVNAYEGTLNSAFGSKALFANTTGYYNTATGTNALRNNSTGAQNTANGTGALVSNTIGIANTAVGLNTMSQNNIGNENSAVGNFALAANTSGSRNTGLGMGALGTNTTGNNNTAIGYAADVNSINLSNATAIGYNAKVAASNSLILGGTGADAVNVGIGITIPKARLHVTDSSVVFSAADPVLATPGNPPLSGAGARMMWYTGKGAFRTGYISGNQWDKDNIGYYSFASGLNTKASGFASTSMGSLTIAIGNASTSMGQQTNALGNASTSMGSETIATGNYSTSMGVLTFAKAVGAVTIGSCNDNTDNPSTIFFGNTDRVFQIGNGSSDALRSNALTVLRNGNTGIGTTNPTRPLSFPPTLGEKILLFPGGAGEVGIGVYNNEMRFHTDYNGADITFGNSNNSNVFTETLRIKGNGNVGIGNNNPNRPLSFPATLGEKILLYPGGAGEVGIGVYGNELRLHADNPGAKVSFGTQDNAGNFTENALAQRNGVYAFSVLGSLWVNGTTYASDERFKQNITPIQSPLQKLLQLNGVEYEMKTAAFAKNYFQPGRQIGLLAQNVEKTVPEAVNEKDGYKGVDYARLVPLLIEAIKEQEARIQILENQLKKNNHE
jgi:hypothetical protein